jgi:uncharacterized membrane-anchored protein
MKESMNWEKFKGILSLLNRCELTLRERQFVQAVERYFHENGKMTDQQESILEGICKEKIWIGKVFINRGKLLKKSSSFQQ